MCNTWQYKLRPIIKTEAYKDLQLYDNSSGSLLWPQRPRTTKEAMEQLGGRFDFSVELTYP